MIEEEQTIDYNFSDYLTQYNPILNNNYKRFYYNKLNNYIEPFFDFSNLQMPFQRNPQTYTIESDQKVEEQKPETQKSEERKDTVVTPNQSKDTSQIRQNIINTARKHVGGDYIWGGNGHKNGKKGGFDCSGLIFYAYTQNGFDRKKMPRQSGRFENHGKKVTLDEAQPGDIIHTKGHVKMLSKKVNGQWWVVEAAGKKTGIVERPLKSTKNIISIRNYVDYLRSGGLLSKPSYLTKLK